MSSQPSAKEVIALLHDIEQRGRRNSFHLPSSDADVNIWTGLGFRIGQQHCLLSLSEAREILPVPQNITAVPKARPWVYGMSNLRGELLPLFDLNHFLYSLPTKASKKNRIIIINHPELYSGLLIDEVLGLKHFQHQPKPDALTTDQALSNYITGHLQQQNIDWHIFSINQLASDHRFCHAAA